MLMVVGKSISLIIYTGATYLALPEFSGPFCPSQVSIMGVDSLISQPIATPNLYCQFINSPFPHSFLISPRCPISILGLNILSKFHASLFLSPPSTIHPAILHFLLLTDSPVMPSSPLSPSLVNPTIWDTSTPFVT